MIKSNLKSSDSFTLAQFISLKDSDQITYKNFSILQESAVDKRIVYSIDNVLYDYMDELKQYRKLVTVSNDEKAKYIYKPKLLAYDIYGTTECYFVLLALNGMCNVKEFDLRDNAFWAIAPTDMNIFLDTVYRAERDRINLNRKSLTYSEN